MFFLHMCTYVCGFVDSGLYAIFSVCVHLLASVYEVPCIGLCWGAGNKNQYLVVS